MCDFVSVDALRAAVVEGSDASYGHLQRAAEQREGLLEKQARMTREQEAATAEAATDAVQALRTSKAALRGAKKVLQHSDAACGLFTEQHALCTQLVREVSPMAARLLSLERERAYVSLLAAVDSTSCAARSAVQSKGADALEKVLALAGLRARVRDACPPPPPPPPACAAAAPPAPTLRATLDSRLRVVARQLRAQLDEEAGAALESMGWPRADEKHELQGEQGAAAAALRKAATALLELQRGLESGIESSIEGQLGAATAHSAGNASDDAIWAVRPFLQPLRKRFLYHFTGSASSTNRLDRPEWFLGFVLKQARLHALPMEQLAQPLFEGAGCYSGLDAQALLLRGLVGVAKRRCRQLLLAVRSAPSLFRHGVDELLRFEAALDEEFAYDACCSSASAAGAADEDAAGALLQPPLLHWPRCADLLLEEEGLQETWLNADLENGLAALRAALQTEDAWAPLGGAAEVGQPSQFVHAAVAILLSMVQQHAALPGRLQTLQPRFLLGVRRPFLDALGTALRTRAASVWSARKPAVAWDPELGELLNSLHFVKSALLELAGTEDEAKDEALGLDSQNREDDESVIAVVALFDEQLGKAADDVLSKVVRGLAMYFSRGNWIAGLRAAPLGAATEPQVSAEAAESFACLERHVRLARQSLAPPVFATFVHQLAKRLSATYIAEFVSQALAPEAMRQIQLDLVSVFGIFSDCGPAHADFSKSLLDQTVASVCAIE